MKKRDQNPIKSERSVFEVFVKNVIDTSRNLVLRPNNKKLLQESSVFCMAPWTHIHVVPPGKTFPCCASGHRHDLAIGDLKKAGETLKDSWNSERMRRLRRDMLAGRKNELCERCHKYEELGKESERKWFNDGFKKYYSRVEKTNIDGSLDEFKPYYLDIRFSNTCNLKCRICLHELSSAWYNDSIELGLIPKNTDRKVFPTSNQELLWPQVRPLLNSLDRIHFAGGEPLLMEEHYMVLDELIRLGKTKITITYNTNFSRLIFKNRDVLDLWKKFDEVHVFASLDGMGEKGDYMRKGQKWEEVEKNRIRLMEECPHVKFCINATVSLMNVLHIPEFYKDWYKRGLIGPNDINLYLLFNPSYYSVQTLPKDIKKQVTEAYRNFEEEYLNKFEDDVSKVKTHFKSIIEFMNEKDMDELTDLRTATRSLDKIRKESFIETFPELAEVILE